jgi:hypothetical protein
MIDLDLARVRIRALMIRGLAIGMWLVPLALAACSGDDGGGGAPGY